MYGKFYQSTFTGSMYAAGANVFAVWGYIIAHADKHGELELNPPVVAGLLGMTPDDVRCVLDYLLASDPSSRSPEYEGRRLVHLRAFEYLVPQYTRYSGIKNQEHRREQNRIAKRNSRIRQAKLENADRSAMSAHVDVDVDVDVDIDGSSSTHGTSAGAYIPDATKKQAIKMAREWLDQVRAEYPKRRGGQKWPLAEERIRSIVKSGQAEPNELLAGVIRYRKFCEADGIVGARTVMQAATFFGPGAKGWLEDWDTEPVPDQADVLKRRRQLDDWARSKGWDKRGLMIERGLSEEGWYAALEQKLADRAGDSVAVGSS